MDIHLYRASVVFLKKITSIWLSRKYFKWLLKLWIMETHFSVFGWLWTTLYFMQAINIKVHRLFWWNRSTPVCFSSSGNKGMSINQECSQVIATGTRTSTVKSSSNTNVNRSECLLPNFPTPSCCLIKRNAGVLIT